MIQYSSYVATGWSCLSYQTCTTLLCLLKGGDEMISLKIESFLGYKFCIRTTSFEYDGHGQEYAKKKGPRML